jgi:hypothetical protein
LQQASYLYDKFELKLLTPYQTPWNFYVPRFFVGSIPMQVKREFEKGFVVAL